MAIFIRGIVNGIYLLAVGFLVVVAVVTALTIIKAPGEYRAFVVMSGSMEPAIKTGSVVFVGPVRNSFAEGDIITYLAGPEAKLRDVKSTVTHRIVKIIDNEGRKNYVTKGDANNVSDREPIKNESILGKVIFSVPYLGHIVGFAKTQAGFVCLIVIPGTLIIYSELMTIKEEIKKIIIRIKKT